MKTTVYRQLQIISITKIHLTLVLSIEDQGPDEPKIKFPKTQLSKPQLSNPALSKSQLPKIQLPKSKNAWN